MIEIVYNKEKETAAGNEEYFCIPRNIRQIGHVPSHNRIYIEDYAYDYLNTRGKENDKTGNAAILLGKCNWKEGISYIFVKSALFMEKLEVSAEHISMTDEVWGSIYEEMKTYFPGQEVVGWYLSLPGNALRITDMIYRTHLNHFGGNDKALFLADSDEQEEAFFLYRNGHLEKQDGFYIYYEKNTPMQEYMLKKKPRDSVDGTGKVQDRAVNDFRKIIARKKEEKENRNNNQFLYAAGMGVVALSLALGVTFVSRQMKMGLPTDNSGMSFAEGIGENGNAQTAAEILTGAGENAQIDEENSVLSREEPEADLNLQQANGEIDVNGASKDSKTASMQTAKDENTADDQTAGAGSSEEQAAGATSILEQNNENTESASGQNQSDQDELPTQANRSGTGKYTIRSGDTLSSISVAYYGNAQKVKEICKLNDLKEDDIIYPGQVILLP